ncbi:MAG TPA: TlpA disulfide reductase family protein [Fimbriimonadaceae bacterium]|nr:TlpA disulfide reductase family protein [Fimbriimonadaceae bacterium]
MRPVFALGLLGLACLALAQKTADEHFEGIQKEVPPPFSQPIYAQEGQKYLDQYKKEVRKSEDRRNDLIKAFFDAFPDDPRLPDLMVQRWVSLFNSGDSSAKVGKDIDDSIKKTESEDMAVAGMFSRLVVNILDPKSKMDVSKGIDEFRKKYKSDKRYKQLMQLAAVQTDGDTRRHVIDLFAKDFPDSEFTALYQGQLKQSDSIGKPFPLKFKDAVTGKDVDIKDFAGKVVLVQWWSTKSAQSREAVSPTRSLYEKYHDQGLEVIGVSLDPSDSLDVVKEFVASHRMPWPQDYLGDGMKSALGQEWGIMTLPTHFLIDKKGLLRQIEPLDLEQEVKKLLKG